MDDMELAAAELYQLTRHERYVREALRFAAREPVMPWMGADTANHYQWFPWHNNGHNEISRAASAMDRTTMAEYYRRGLQAVVDRAGNGFKVGIPFIWCSNNLMASFATQALLYRQMTGDERFREHETAALDWLLGVNPWGTSMIIGFPNGGVWAKRPHSVVADRMGVQTQLGGLLDGPMYHDDLGDYSTNEPIMDGTANLTYLFAAMVKQ